MKKALTVFYVVSLLFLGGCQYFGWYPAASTERLSTPKNVRNNPAAFRSFYATSFTGK